MWNRIDLLDLSDDPFYILLDTLPIGSLNDADLERLGDLIIEYTDSNIYDWLPADEQQWINEFALQLHEEWLSRDSADAHN